MEAPRLSILRTPGWCIETTICRYFSEFFERSNTGRTLNWHLFHDFIQLYFMDLLDSQNLWNLCFFSLTTFLRYDCPNSFLIQGIIEIRHRYALTDGLLTKDVYTILYSLRRPMSLEWKCSFGRHLNCLKSTDAVYAGDLVLLQVLVKYGFTYESPSNFPLELKQARDILQKF